MLDASSAQAIILTAPAGFGKTSLACEWLDVRTDVAWYRATSASADLAAFSAGIAEVMEPLVAGAGDRLRQRLRIGEPPEKAVRPLAELLAEDIAGWPDGAWLVLDDYHLVCDSLPVEEFMDWLLTLAPLRVLVTTRRRPAWASARRVLHGDMTELGRDQLAMTADEAARVLERLSPEAIAALVAQAQGWPALIGLAALSPPSEIPTERVSEELFRYFAEEVFRGETAEVQRFMLVASVPQTISVRLAEEVLEIPDADEMLEHLSNEGFLQQTVHGDFALHPLLRAFLWRKLQSGDSILAERLSDRVIVNARSTGRWEEAFEVSVRSNRLDDAAEIIGDAATELLSEGRIETLETWLVRCHDRVVHHPAAMLTRAEIMMRRGRLSNAYAIARSLSEQLPPASHVLSKAWRTAGRAAHFLSEEENALACHLAALDTALAHAERAEAIWGAVVSSAELELPTVDGLIEELRALPEHDISRRIRIPMGQAMAARSRGSLEGISSLIEPALPFAEYVQDPVVRSGFLAYVGYLKYLQAQYPTALLLAREAQEICARFQLLPETIHCQIMLAGIAISCRQIQRAMQLIQEISAGGAGLGDPWVAAMKDCLLLRLAITRGSTAITPTVPPGLKHGDAPRDIRAEVEALTALVEVVAGRQEHLSTRLAMAKELTRTVETRFLIRLCGVIATDGQTSTATSESARGLFDDMRRAEVLDLWVLGYRAHPRLLSLLSVDGSLPSEVMSVVRTSNDLQFAKRHGISIPVDDRMDGGISSLTRRELEVLELIGDGLSNREIAKSLVIAPSTAKVHVHNILRKLAVSTRLQAALVAQALRDR